MQKNEFGLPPKVYDALTAGMEAFFQTTGRALKEALSLPDEPKPVDADGSPLLGGPSYPPAMDGETMLSNTRAGYAEEGLRGGRIIPDWLLQSRVKRLDKAFQAGDRYGVPRDTMEIVFLLGRVTDGKDVPDPNDPNPATPSFKAPWEYLENYRGMTADALVQNYWAEKAAGTPSF